MTARIWFWLHSLIGVTAGLLLFVIAWSGATAVFSREIDWVLNPSVRVQGAHEIESWEGIAESVRRAFPGSVIQSLSAPWAPGFAVDVLINTPSQDNVHVYVNPSTARVQGSTSFFNIQRFFRSFHMELFWGIQRWGYYLVGSISLVLLASAMTALTFYKRWWRGFFKLETERGLTIALSDLHKLLGVWCLGFVLIISVTGFWYLIKRMDGVFFSLPHSEQQAVTIEPQSKAQPQSALALDDLVARVHAVRADLEIRTIYLPPKGTAPIRFDGFAGDLLARESANEVALNPVDGRVVSAARARDLSPFFRWVESADFLHTGRWGGLVTRIAWFFFGAATASMSLTGVYLQVKKQARDHRRMPRAAVAISYACVLLILTISIQGAFSEIRSYGAYLGDRQSFPDIALGVRGFIAAWTLTLIVPLLLWARWVR